MFRNGDHSTMMLVVIIILKDVDYDDYHGDNYDNDTDNVL